MGNPRFECHILSFCFSPTKGIKLRVTFEDDTVSKVKEHIEKHKQAYIVGAACALLFALRGRKTQVTVVLIQKES